ncbi:uncharacterized protein BDV17DRAFT_268552 [Aspergillus undulatus]|uniref:uncharacterized protein n=1 Tax=Aspergillus undulatus TaxID=1810928 RepID=UPI003CCD840C
MAEKYLELQRRHLYYLPGCRIHRMTSLAQIFMISESAAICSKINTSLAHHWACML